MESYNRYKIARDTAWKILIEKRITTFPIDLTALMSRVGIQIITFRQAQPLLDTLQTAVDETLAAYYFKLGGQKIICYNHEQAPKRIRFSLAHEFGRNGSRLHRRGRKRLCKPLTYAGNRMSLRTAAQRRTDSRQAAEIRAKRIAELNRRNKWLTSNLETQYYNLYIKNPIKKRRPSIKKAVPLKFFSKTY